MGLLELIVLIVVIGLIIWLVQVVIAPRLPAPWGTVIIVILVILLILYLASRFLGLNL